MRQADSSSTMPVGILGAKSPLKSLSDKDLEEALEALGLDKLETFVTKIKAKKNKKESSKDKKQNYNFKCRLQEGTDGNVSVYKVVLIQEGLGNFANAFYYGRDSLESAAPLFEGKKIYANHPSESEEEDRPERDVRQILGHYENCEIVESEGRAELHADLVIPEGKSFDWGREICDAALKFREKFTDQEFVGLSINAGGDAKETDIDEVLKICPDACKPKLLEAKEQGISTVMVVSEISNAKSTDLVTEAGAGGKILKLMEEAKVKTNKGKKIVEADGEKTDDDHSDADADKALFGKMMKKHLDDSGDKSGIEEGDHEMVQSKYEACKEMGMKAEEAFGAAVASHKLDKHMKQKKEAADKVEADKVAAEEAAKKEADGQSVPTNPNKESNDVLKLSGRVAFLEAALNKKNLEKYIDKKLSESKLPRSVTKLFLEKAKEIKNEKDFNEKFEIFTEAYKADRDSDSFVPFIEKTSFQETDASGDFSDCVTE